MVGIRLWQRTQHPTASTEHCLPSGRHCIQSGVENLLPFEEVLLSAFKIYDLSYDH